MKVEISVGSETTLCGNAAASAGLCSQEEQEEEEQMNGTECGANKFSGCAITIFSSSRILN